MDRDGPNGSPHVKISLFCMNSTLGVEVVFECLMFVREYVGEQELVYSRMVKLRASQLENDSDDFMKELEN
eukprot:5248055-Pleurochrysis_carterae.AAC.1